MTDACPLLLSVQSCILEMEYCGGGSLADVLRILRLQPGGYQLPPSAKLNLVRRMALARW
jgi:hypothetical protein